jgi:hypothetical protein
MMTELEQVVDRGNRGRLWFLVAIGVLCLGIAGTVAYTIVVNVQQGKRLSKIESPCQKYGADSKQCEEAFSLAVSTITHPQACAVERKAGTLRAIRELADELGVDFTEPCAGARIAQERERSSDRAETRSRRAAAGGDAQQTGSTGHQQPSPPSSGGGGSGTDAGKGGGGQGPQPGQDGSGDAPAPGQNGSDGGSAPPPGGTGAEQSRETPAPTTNEAADPEPHPLPEAVEAAGGAVGQAGGAAQGVVEGTGKAAGCVLRGSC